MAGLMDILLALVKVLCGGSTTQEEQPPPKYPSSQRPHAERPQTQERPPKPTFESQVPADKPQSPKPQHEGARYKDQNQLNHENEHYLGLRAKANEEEGHEAYDRREGARAKELSEKGKQHQRAMESLNAEASAWIFRGEVRTRVKLKLHGLYVKEAISYSEKAIQEAQQRGDPEIRLIVGKGIHSEGHVAKLKPAVEDLTQSLNLPTEVDPLNAGVLIVRLR
ncbi:DUF1771-domain-containing protein [Melanogaster broomeanus]|nr:DUF1771-domain-containing protein [Melanogaster broomeanus]